MDQNQTKGQGRMTPCKDLKVWMWQDPGPNDKG
jgi:hypothetical protein